MSSEQNRKLYLKAGTQISISEIEWKFNPSGGPGGQHANRSNTRVEAELDLTAIKEIDDETKNFLIQKVGSVLRVVEDSSRSQSRNRKKSIDRLEKILQDAFQVQKKRHPTKPGRNAVQRRLEIKNQRSKIKNQRKNLRNQNWD